MLDIKTNLMTFVRKSRDVTHVILEQTTFPPINLVFPRKDEALEDTPDT